MWSTFEASNPAFYAVMYWQVIPLITTFMPIANSARPVSLSFAQSVMSCLRAKNVNKGSEVPPDAPAPTPVGSSGSSSNTTLISSYSAQNTTNAMLSGGAIAGIAIGAIGGIALVVGLVLFIRKRRAAGKVYARQPSEGSNYGDMELTRDKGPGAGIAEVEGYSRMGEVPDTNLCHEMHVQPTELDDKRLERSELPA
jgi:hypothetical protein